MSAGRWVRMGNAPYHQEDVLRELYCRQELGIAEIADRFDVAESTIWTWLDKNGIETSTFDSAEERFHRNYKVLDGTGCWMWTGATQGAGYGQIGVDGGKMGAHRYSYKLHNGEIPDGAYICHKCHNPPCVNPDHLYAGDPKSNAQDAIENGDWPQLFGEKQSTAVLTNKQVREIREGYHNTAVTYKELCDQYNVSMGTVSRVINGETYPNAGGPIKQG